MLVIIIDEENKFSNVAGFKVCWNSYEFRVLKKKFMITFFLYFEIKWGINVFMTFILKSPI